MPVSRNLNFVKKIELDICQKKILNSFFFFKNQLLKTLDYFGS